MKKDLDYKINLNSKISWTESKLGVRLPGGCYGEIKKGLFRSEEKFTNCSKEQESEIKRISQSFDPKIKQRYEEIGELLKTGIKVGVATSFASQGNLPAAFKTVILN